MSKRRQVILDAVDDMVTDFLFYDRKEDEDLRLGQIEAAIAAHEIVQAFRDALRAKLKR